MAWWRAARFGMFIHFGVYSTVGRQEWVLEEEGIPLAEY
jgi:alpha-L-fucosidase